MELINVARSYDDVMARHLITDEPELKELAEVADAHFKAEYQEIFGIGDIGDALAARRHELNLSQKELSAKTGITQADISKVENGKGNPTFLTIQKILNALDLDLVPTPRTHDLNRIAS